MSAFTPPDHLRDHTPPILWTGTTEAAATFTAPWDGLLVTKRRSVGAVVADNPLYGGIRVVGMLAPDGELPAMVPGIPIPSGTVVNLVAGEDTAALVDAPVSNVLSFLAYARPAGLAGIEYFAGAGGGPAAAASLPAATSFNNTTPSVRPL